MKAFKQKGLLVEAFLKKDLIESYYSKYSIKQSEVYLYIAM